MNLAWSESTTIQTYLFLICGESHLWYSNPYGVFEGKHTEQVLLCWFEGLSHCSLCLRMNYCG